jgi:iron complex outermembrane receptor protein
VLHLLALSAVVVLGGRIEFHGVADESAASNAARRADAPGTDVEVDDQVEGDYVDAEDAADELVVRQRRSSPPRALEIPIRREGLAVGGASAAALLTLVPGMFVSQHAGQGKAPQLFLRGFDVEHGQDLEVRVEGVPINEAGNVHGHGYADTTFVPIELVSRLRLDEGVADPRQGNFAVAGSVDHSVGLALPGLIIKGSLGSFGLQRAFLGARPEGWSERTFFGAELVRSDGFGARRAFARVNLLGSVEARLLPGLVALAMVATSTSRFESAGVVRLGEGAIDTLDDNAFFGSAIQGQGGRSERHLGVIRLRQLHDGGHSTTLQLFGSRRRLALQHNFTGRLQFPAGDTVAQHSDADTIVSRAEHEHALSLLGSTHRVRIGGEARGDLVTIGQRRLDDDDVTHTDELDARLALGHLGLWIDGGLQPTSWLQLRLGGRAEAVTSTLEDALESARSGRSDGLFVGPRFSAVTSLTEDLEITAGYGEGFRTPPPIALADGEVARFTVVRTVELGAQQRHHHSMGAFRARLSGFVSHVERDRVFDHATATSVLIGPSLRSGLQAFVDVLGDAFGVTGSATFTDARLLEGGAVPFAPPVVVRIDGFSTSPTLTLAGVGVCAQLELGASLIGPRPLPLGESANPVALIDGALSIRAGLVRIALEGLNLMDARVADGVFVYASRFTDDDRRAPTQHITAGSPRQLQLSVSLSL